MKTAAATRGPGAAAHAQRRPPPRQHRARRRSSSRWPSGSAPPASSWRTRSISAGRCANREALLPSRAAVDEARAVALAARDRLRGKMEILFVRPDYYADRPRACMDGWARRYVVVTPDGIALPCHQALEIAALRRPGRTSAARSLGGHLERRRRLPRLSRRGLDARALPDLRRADHRLRRLPLPGLRAARRRRRHRSGLRARAPARPGRRGARRTPRTRRPSRRSGCAACVRFMKPAAIEVIDLKKRYAEVEAVRGIGFTVGAGEIFGFLGPNGAGKTTTIKILCTLLQATSGTARLAGLDVAASPAEVRRRIGVIFQDPALDDRLTAEENLMLHAVAYRVPRAERRRAHRRGAAVRRSLRAPQGSDPHLLGRHEAPAGDRAGPGPPPRHPVPRRADHRPRSADARADLGGAARPAGEVRDDAVPHHALHGRGRELRSDRHRRSRAHRRARHAGRAQAAGRQGSDRGADRRSGGAGAAAPGEIWPREHAGRRRLDVPGRRGGRLHRQAAHRHRSSAAGRDQRPPPDAGRRLPLADRPADPRRGGRRKRGASCAPWSGGAERCSRSSTRSGGAT